ncbi:MAG: V-type ATP synthase subunit F [Acholeplasmataceae bacterium]
MRIEIACLGENEDIILFQGVGITTFVIKDRDILIEKIEELASIGTKIILVSDIFNEAIEETVVKYQTKPYPIILSLPLSGIESQKGLDKIRKDVERAIGINIF